MLKQKKAKIFSLLNLTVGKKILLGFFLVIIISSTPGVIGILSVKNIAKIGDEVMTQKMPLSSAATSALLNAERVVIGVKELLNKTGNLQEQQDLIHGALERSEVYLSMVLYGTDSMEFKESSVYQEYLNEHSDLVIPIPAQGTSREISEKALKEFKNLKILSENLIAIHEEKSNYVFKFRDRKYAIDDFMYRLNSNLLDWIIALEESAKNGTSFSPNLNFEKSDFALWHNTYKSDDPELAKKLQAFSDTNKRMFEEAQKLENAPADKKELYYQRGANSYFSKDGKALKNIANYVTPLFHEIEKKEQENTKQVDSSMHKIEVLLMRLTEEIGDDLNISKERAIETEHQAEQTTMISGVVGMIIGLCLAFMVGKSISCPLVNMTESMETLADGNLDVEINGLNRKDEIGNMASALQIFKENAIKAERLHEEQRLQEERAEEEKRKTMNQLADAFEQEVGGVISTVSSAATEMEATAESMAGVADQASDKAQTVDQAAQEASGNVSAVASASEELATSISEINSQVLKSTQVAGEAKDKANETSERVQELVSAVDRIGVVVTLISDIAEQTNLLALNATIEAARAGEAGKGFAVVASEVKNLASETAKATEEISTQINGIQSATRESEQAIQDILEVINRIDGISNTVAAAVEEQGAATNEISRNVQQASQATNQVTQNITEVTQAASETGQSAGMVWDAAGELSKQANVLSDTVNGFLEKIRSE
jgi:methyl-accepting chemotaxis protein